MELSMKSIRQIVLLGVFATGFSGLISFRLHAQNAAARQPVTITMQSSSPSNPGRVLLVTESHREDGSLATSAATPGAAAQPLLDVIDLAARRHFVKDPLTGLYDEMALSPQTIRRHAAAPATCEEAAGPGARCDAAADIRILGYPVQRAVLTMRNRGGQTLELFLAPDLGYLPLKRVSRRGDQVLSEVVAVSITPGSPDPSLFALPPHFQRAASSSQFLMAVEKARGESSSLTPDAAARLDAMQNAKQRVASIR
jgi:hypothetical protein